MEKIESSFDSKRSREMKKIQEEGNATGSIEYQNMQIKLGGKLSGDIKMSDKIQPIKKETKESDNKSSISLQESMKAGDK